MKTKENNAKKMPTFLIVATIIFFIVLIVLYYLLIYFSIEQIIPYSGYAVTGKKLTQNLLNSQNLNEAESIKAVKIEEQDKLFRRLNQYYIGEENKQEVNIEYPIYINDKIALYNLAEELLLINSKYEQTNGYPRLTITDGSIYNPEDLEKADKEEYLFAKNVDGIFINLKEMHVKTELNEYTMPLNSLIYFREQYIAYYRIEGEEFKYQKIEDIDSSSKVTINSVDCTYNELLNKLGIGGEAAEEEKITKEPIDEQTQNKEEEPNKNPVTNQLPVQNNELVNNMIEQNNVQDGETNNEFNNIQGNEQNNPNQNSGEPEQPYIKPEVTIEEFVANVYSASSSITISDPQGRINNGVVFVVKKGSKVILRKTIYQTGDIRITGLQPNTKYQIDAYYIYVNQEGNKIQNDCFSQEMTTKDLNELEPIKLQFENGEIFPNKIEIKNLKIISDLSSESLVGVQRIEIEINNSRYTISKNNWKKMTQGEEITAQTSESLPSNSVIHYEIKLYDSFGNELIVENGTGTTRTCKNPPTATIKVDSKNQSVYETVLKINLINKDKVELSNYRYILFDKNGIIEQEDSLNIDDTKITFTNLNADRTYTIHILADYDLDDGKGKRENQILCEVTFNTISLDTLGTLNLLGEVLKVEKDNVEFSMQINEVGTDYRLVNILEEIKVSIYNEEKDSYFEKVLSKEQIEELKQYSIEKISFTELLSNTTYHVVVEGKVKQGSTEQNIKKVEFSLKEFTTYKKPAQVLVQNKFITESKIYFDTKVIDEDLSILEDSIRLELRNYLNQLVEITTITRNGELQEICFDKLSQNTEYTVHFIAQNYNEGFGDSTKQSNYEIDSFTFVIEKGISGKLQLLNLSRKPTGKNLVDITSKVKWYSTNVGSLSNYYNKQVYETEGEQILKLLAGKSSSAQYYTYKLPDEYIGKTVTMTFEAKFDQNVTMSEVYIINYKNSTSTSYRLTPKNLNSANLVQNLNTEEWKKIEATCTVNATGYIGFYLKASSSSDVQNLLIKNLQIEEGNNASEVTEFAYTTEAEISINVEDVKSEIDKYFIDIYKDGTLIKREEYDTANFTQQVRYYTLDNNATYEFRLVITKENKEYVISQTTFVTKEEIKGIRNVDDYLNISVDGNYMVLDDLDFTGSNRSGDNRTIGSTNYGFRGVLDFQGHTVKVDDINSTRGIIYIIEETGLIKNLVLDIYLNNAIEKSTYRGLVESNRGKITNLQINLKESTNVPNVDMALIGNSNYGELSNFVINIEVPFYGSRSITGGFLNCYGTIKNGYAYGENIICTEKGISYNQARSIGVVVSVLQRGFLQNVYSLVNVDGKPRSGLSSVTYDVVGNIIYNNSGGNVKNVYSVGASNLALSQLNYGPTIGINSGNITDSYYFVDDTNGTKNLFNNTFNEKISKFSVIDTVFQNGVLNSENQFIVDDYVNKGYYPQIKMDDCMPLQKYIELPEILEEDKIDILALRILEDNTETNNGMKVELSIRNKSGAKITDIEIQDLDATIESSTYIEESSISNVIVILNNPKQYKSLYQVNSITWKGTYGGSGKRTYSTNEKRLAIDFYKPIYNEDDWKNINNSLSENYKLMADLDFSGKSEDEILIKGTYKGKIDGAGHTMKNITTGKGIIYTLEGELKNLNINHYTQNMSETYAGIIRYANMKTVIDNVHVDTMNITNQTEKDSGDIGGLVGYITNAMIQNSSVKNLTVTIDGKISVVRVGGLVGRADNIKISNCFVENANISVKNVLKSGGIGGIIGTEQQNGAYVRYCYATGNIDTDCELVGGIYGYTSGDVKYNYSLVNLKSKTDFLGGIGGYDANSLSSSTYGNLSLGSIFSIKDSDNIRRIIGSNYSEIGNYAYINQTINGYLTSDVLGADFLLTNDNLKSPELYMSTLNWQNNFDYSQLNQGILPKIYNTNGKDLLPNQGDNKLQEVSVSVKDVYVPKEHEVDNAIITISVNNPQQYEITDIIFGDEANEDLVKEKLKSQSNGNITEIQYRISPKRAYDCYTVTGIKYKDVNGTERIQTEKVVFDVKFFHKIANSQEWINQVRQDTEENYILTGDIVFTNEQTQSIKMNYSIGRLYGQGKKISFNDELNNVGKTISGKEQGFIKNVEHAITDVTFENIKITNDSAVNYTGLIVRNTGDIENCTFNNITINAPKASYVGMIASNAAIEISNVHLNNITISGKNYTSGFLAYTDSGNYTDISADNINIKSTGNYSAGIVAYVASRTPNNLSKFYGNEITIDSTGDYIGGLIGSGRLGSSNIISSNIKGKSYVGGIGGSFTSASYHYAKECTITSSGNYSGVIAGSGSVYYAVVEDCAINGSGYTGGILGNGACYYSGIINSHIIATGNYTGGIVGTASGCDRNFAQGCTVQGKGYVGGIVGHISSGTVQYCYNNSKITATENYAGGIVGYLSNTDMTNANKTTNIRLCYSVNDSITAKKYVGGMIGYVTDSLYMSESHYYSNLSVANVNAEDASTAHLMVGGSKDEETLNGIRNEFLQNKNYTYDKSSVNGKQIEGNDYSYIDDSGETIFRIFTEDQLRDENTYKTTLSWSTTYYAPEKDKYPKLTKTYTGRYYEEGSSTLTYIEQEGIEVPGITTVSTISANSLIATMSLNSNHNVIKELPKVYTYAIDVDKMNIEFSSIEPNTYFNYTIDGKKSKNIPIDQKVYTIQYDYKTPVSLSVTNNTNTNTIEIKSEDIENHITAVGEEYYYIENLQLKNNHNQTLEGNFVNVYGNKALREDGAIYNLENKKLQENVIENMKIEEVAIPIEESQYNGKTIQSYAKVSIVKQGDTSVERKGQIYVRGNKLGVIDYSVSKVSNGQIIDSYNQNEYQTILGTNGKLYNLKSPLHYPNGFTNKNIKEITTDKKDNVAIYYNTGRVYVFNYITGKLIYDNHKVENVSLFDYIKESFSSNAITQDIMEIEPSGYEDSKDIIEDLKEVTSQNSSHSALYNEISANGNTMNSQTNSNHMQNMFNNSSINPNNTQSSNNTSNSDNYITVYDDVSKKYLIYNEEELLDLEKTTVIPETYKLQSQYELYSKYQEKISSSPQIFKLNGAIIVMSIIGVVVVILVILRKRKMQ